MNKLPAIMRRAATAAHRDMLSRWLLARDAELKFRELGSDEDLDEQKPDSTLVTLPNSSPSRVNPYTAGSAEEGQIRLLSPSRIANAPRPVYLALLKNWDEGIWLAAPYSAYSVPALPGELATRRENASLRVLCLWNARTVSPEDLRSSWLVDRMNDQEQTEAWEVFRHAATGVPLPDALQPRVGPHIYRDNDPRIEYQREEMALLATWQAAVQEENSDTGMIYLPWAREAADYYNRRLAADSERPQPVQMLLILPESRLVIDIQPSYDDGQSYFMVFDDKGDPSHQIDGYRLCVGPGRHPYEFRNGQVQIPLASLLDGFEIRDPDGKTMEVLAR